MRGDPVDTASSGEVSLLGLLVVLLRQRHLIILVAGLCTVGAGVVGLLGKRTYTASAAFMPQTTSQAGLSRLAGLAAQFGVSGFTEPTGQSPEFYASLLASHQLLGALVDTAFQVGTDRNASITLAEYFRVAGPDSIHLRQAAIDRLRDAVSASVSVKTGMVNVSVRLHSPDLAYQVLQRQLGLLNEFNLGTRRSRARAERLFIEGRLQEAREEMRQVEDRLLNFLQRNRDFRTSSTLAFEHDRLQRDVAMRQQIVTALAQSYEQARIDEVRDTPVITVVEEPTVPVLPDSRRVIGRSLTGMLLGFFLGVLAGLWREFLTRSRHREETEFDEFVSLRAAALDELRHPFRALRRVASVR